MAVLLGAIADDSTGATDLANTLVKEGMRAVQTIGVPDGDIDLGDAEAVVVALKSRTAPVDEAVDASRAALAWLRGLGPRQFFFKYCSTFDSTPAGNIGPVADALLADLSADFTFLCPAFPDNGRVVRDGLIYVNGELLENSPMKDHPLTPMRDSRVMELMRVQTDREVGLIHQATVSEGPAAIATAVDALRRDGVAYGVIDTAGNDDLRAIGAAAADHALVTGGSGAAMGLPANFRNAGLLGDPTPPTLPQATGRAAVLAGSCSQATRRQIAMAQKDWPHRKIDVHRIAAGDPVAADILDWAAAQDSSTPVLIYGSADPDEVAAIQAQYGVTEAGEMVERVIGEVAAGLVAQGVRRLVVAGGETAGAVVSSLGVKALRIGPEIDTGVPWTETLGTETLGGPPIALALKSGNFGGGVFFAKALRMHP